MTNILHEQSSLIYHVRNHVPNLTTPSRGEEVTLRTVQYSTGSTAVVYFLPSDPTATHLIQPD
jgi:hypothetical protein